MREALQLDVWECEVAFRVRMAVFADAGGGVVRRGCHCWLRCFPCFSVSCEEKQIGNSIAFCVLSTWKAAEPTRGFYVANFREWLSTNSQTSFSFLILAMENLRYVAKFDTWSFSFDKI